MPEFVVLAGPNGVGKSTFYNSYPYYKDHKFLNLDLFASEIAATNDLARYKAAYKNYAESFKKAVANKDTFIQETTLCGQSIFQKIKLAKSSGYKILIQFVYCSDVAICIDRVAHRVSLGGHNIPEKDIVRRYKNSIINLRNNFDIFDEASLYDNTNYFEFVAKFEKGKCVYKCKQLPDWYESSDIVVVKCCQLLSNEGIAEQTQQKENILRV